MTETLTESPVWLMARYITGPCEVVNDCQLVLFDLKSVQNKDSCIVSVIYVRDGTNLLQTCGNLIIYLTNGNTPAILTVQRICSLIIQTMESILQFIQVKINTHTHIYIHIHPPTCTHTHIHTYTHTHTHTLTDSFTHHNSNLHWLPSLQADSFILTWSKESMSDTKTLSRSVV